MSFISNTEIRELYHNGIALVEGLHSSEFHEFTRGSLEAASIKLKVGEIFQEETRTDSDTSPNSLESVDLDQGEMAFVMTRETVSLPSDIGALMFSKSGGLAERGILITNTGHIDPGYSGKLRYAVVNLGNSRFHLRNGDFLVKVMFFKMYRPASPHWGELHDSPSQPSKQQISLLGTSLASIRSKIREEAVGAARKEFWKQGLHVLLMTSTAAFLTAIIGTIVTMNYAMAPLSEREIELLIEQKISNSK